MLLEIQGRACADALLSSDLRQRLADMYARVPQVSCTCDRPGQCCELTEEERAGDFATMYPLYLVEFLNIVDHVRGQLPAERQAELLAATDERPDRCPFLTDEGRCSIHPVRPMACRTYGVLSREQVEEAARLARGNVPQQWVSAFLYTERHTCCPHALPQEPEKVAAHAEAMIRFTYERELVQMGGESGALDGERQAILRESTGRDWVSRWSWGGFNTLVRSPVSWLRVHLRDYWKTAILAD